MRVSEALELAGKSMDSFKASPEKLSIKELYELTDNLRFANNPEVFRATHTFLMNKLLRFLKAIEGLEKNADLEGIEELQYNIREKTGFKIKIDSEILPSKGLKEYMDEIISWA